MERVNRHTNYTRDSSVQRAKFMSLMIYDGYVWFDMQAEFFFLSTFSVRSIKCDHQYVVASKNPFTSYGWCGHVLDNLMSIKCWENAFRSSRIIQIEIIYQTHCQRRHSKTCQQQNFILFMPKHGFIHMNRQFKMNK